MFNRLFLLALFLLSLSGCATYQAPGTGVALNALAKSETGRADREPAAKLPATVALIRVETSGYGSSRNRCDGSGRYCVVTLHDVETPDDLQRLRQLPMVAGLVSPTPAQLPAQLDSIQDLQQTASGLGADILLLYSLDTRFSVDGKEVVPKSGIAPGFLPSRQSKITCTASAILVDVQSGFLYGDAQSTSWRDQDASAWASHAAIERARVDTEVSAFQSLLVEIGKLWRDAVAPRGRQ
jgi:hypothetical protein